MNARAQLLDAWSQYLTDRALGMETENKSLRELAETLGFQNAAAAPGGHDAHRIRMQGYRAAFAAGLSSSDFANVLSRMAREVVARNYDSGAVDHLTVCHQTTVKDFRPAEIGFGAAVSVDLNKPLGELQPVASVSTSTAIGEPVQLATYAARLGVSRQTIVNDDLYVIGDALRKIVALLVRKERASVFAMLGNPPHVLASDGGLLFSEAYGNRVFSSAGGIDAATLGAAMQALRLQPVPGSTDPGNLSPRNLIVNPGDEMPARSILWSHGLMDQINLVVNAAIPSGVFYVQAAPEIAPTLCLARLAGTERPVGVDMTAGRGGSDDSAHFLVRSDFATCALSRFGIVKAAPL